MDSNIDDGSLYDGFVASDKEVLPDCPAAPDLVRSTGFRGNVSVCYAGGNGVKG